MSVVPELWIVAGPNGAGKTTCVQREPIAQLLPDVRFLNPDDLTRRKLEAAGYSGFQQVPPAKLRGLFIEAAEEVESQLGSALGNGERVGVETVLSTDKYRYLVDSVIGANGFVGLIYIALSSPALSEQRVATRVAQGGHSVPRDRLRDRWHNSLDQLVWFAKHASAFWIFDNSDSTRDTPMKSIARGAGGQLRSIESDAFTEIRERLQVLPKAASASP